MDAEDVEPTSFTVNVGGEYGTVIMAGRDSQKHSEAMEGLKEKMPNLTLPVQLRYLPSDLASSQSVRSFKEAFYGLNIESHTLILNAGVMASPQRKQTEDGYEYQFGVNHLGHFLSTNLSIDKSASSGTERDPARVIASSSSAHQIPSKSSKGDLGDLQSDEYTPWGAYGQSKLANSLFSYELDRRCRAKGLRVVSNASHPGVVNTELFRYAGPSPDLSGLFPVENLTKPLLRYVLKTPEDGAKTSVLLATQPEGKLSGRYWQDGRPTASVDFDPSSDSPAAAKEMLPFRPKFTSYDPKIWEESWNESEILVGLRPEDVMVL